MKIELIDNMKIEMMKKSSQYFTTRTVKKQQQKIMSFARERLPDQDEGRSACVLDLLAWYGALEIIVGYLKYYILTYFVLNIRAKLKEQSREIC